MLSGAAVSVALGSPTRGPQAGPRDTIMISAATKPEAQAATDSFRASDDTALAREEDCAKARRVGPRNTIVRC